MTIEEIVAKWERSGHIADPAIDALIAELKNARADLDIARSNVVTMSHYRDRSDRGRDAACALLRQLANGSASDALRARIAAFLEESIEPSGFEMEIASVENEDGSFNGDDVRRLLSHAYACGAVDGQERAADMAEHLGDNEIAAAIRGAE